MKRSSTQKIEKETQASNHTLGQMHLIDIFRTFHPQTTEYTFSQVHMNNLSRIDHVLGHKSSLRKFNKVEIISSIFSDDNFIRLYINYRGKM